MPTTTATKRPPSSPIVAPVDDEEPAFDEPVGEPPAKVARLELEEGNHEEEAVNDEAVVELEVEAPPVEAEAAPAVLLLDHHEDAAMPSVKLELSHLEPPNLPPLSPAINPPSENQDDAMMGQDEEENATKTEEGLDEETAMVIDMAVDAVDMNIATKSEADDDEAAVPTNVDEAAPPEEGVTNESTNAETETIIRRVVVMEEDGTVISTTDTMEEQPIKKTKKERKEFTAQEKLQILSELNGPNPPSVSSLLEKYGVSKSSLHRWRQPEKMERLQEMADGSDGIGAGDGGNGNHTDKSKKRDMNDKLRKIKLGLQSFCKDNLTRDVIEQLAITSSLIQLKASEIKDELLKRHEVVPNVLTDEEVSALQAFKGSKSWSCLIGNQLGYLSTAGSVKWSDHAKANTASYLEQNARMPPKPKKQRMEFTAQEKLMILQELENTNVQNRTDGAPPLTVEQICKKYHTSKSSLHRWKQQYKTGRLQELAESGSGYCHAKRVFNDKLHVIKKALNDFYVENENAPVEERVSINYTTLQARAIMAKEMILERHHGMAVVSRTNLGALQAEVEGGQQAEGEGGEGAQQAEVHAGEGEHQIDAGEGAQQVEDGEGAQQAEIHAGEAAQQAEVPASEGAQQAEGEGGEGEQQAEVKGAGEGQEGVVRGEKVEDESRQTENAGSVSCNDITMSKEEVHAVENFKASNSWLRETAKKFGWKLDMDGKKDSGIMGFDIVDDMVTTATSVPAAASAVYHNHGVEHPVGEHLGVEHPVVEHPGAEHHVMAQDHAVAVEQGDPGAVEGHHHHVHDGVVEGGHQVINEHHHEQHQQHVDHLAPNMAVYDAQGNVIAEMLEDPLMHVEDHDVGAMVNGPSVDI